MSTPLLPMPPEDNFLFYRTEDGQTQVRVLVSEKTAWMSQKAIAELYGIRVPTVNEHIRNILTEDELAEDSVIREYLITANDGKNYRTKCYSLLMIIAIGYRVRGQRGTQFRQWATQTLQEYLVKGFVLDDERLKACEKTFGEDYFEELLERIRDIRSSERRFYQKITDIYATAVDYQADAETTRTFYATVQNKLHWAITGQTAPELIAGRVAPDDPHLGLTTWKNAPTGVVRRADVTIAKNYLNEGELSELNRIVEMYLIYAEDQARRQNPMTMQKWAERLDAFLQFNDREVLRDAGRVSREVADRLAVAAYEAYRTRLIQEKDQQLSDFDRIANNLLEKPEDTNGE